MIETPFVNVLTENSYRRIDYLGTVVLQTISWLCGLGKECFDLHVIENKHVPERGVNSSLKSQCSLLEPSDLQGKEELSTPSEFEKESLRGLIELYIENTRPLTDWEVVMY